MPLSWLERWAPLLVHVISSAAQGIILGARSAGVTHETVATTISKVILGVTSNGVHEGAVQAPSSLPPGP